MVAGATKLALNQIDSGRAEAANLEGQIAEIDAQTKTLMQVMMNPLIDKGALTAFSRQISEKEGERKKVELRLSRAGAPASHGQERLAKHVHTAYRRACESFSQIVSPGQLNRFVEDYVGTMNLRSDGVVVPRSAETTTASDESEAVVHIAVAGGGFEPPTSGL